MISPSVPYFLVIQVPDLVAARACFGPAATAIVESGGLVLCSAFPRDVEVLEAGTRLEAVLIARWDRLDELDEFWSTAAARDLLEPVTAIDDALIVSVKGVPAAGLPGNSLPTVATVSAFPSDTPPAYMLVQGTVKNPGHIEKYVSIIMPMLRERGGYYVVYAEASDVMVRHGRWNHQAFIISRWPNLGAARDFWWCARYQDLAIPTRTGHGSFTVLLMPGQAG